MNKFKISILAGIFIFSLSGCSAKKDIANNNSTNITNNNSSSTSVKSGAYKDGVYDIKQVSTKSGYEEAVVTIKDGKIENIELKRLDKKQKEVNYNQWDGTKWGYPNLKQYRFDLAKTMLDKQSADVDVITGATESSKGWKKAVSEALSKAQ